MTSEQRPLLSQSQSLLFRLPAEIRQQIYEYVLGGTTVHFILTDAHGLEHCACQYEKKIQTSACPRQDQGKRYCLGPGLKYFGDPFAHAGVSRERVPRGMPTKLSLLETCRRIYLEGIDILPSQNTTSIIAQYPRGLATLSEIQKQLGPEHLQKIRSLEMSYVNHLRHIENDPQYWFGQWARFCATLANMNGLQSLHLGIEFQEGRIGPLSSSHEAKFFGPLLSIKGLKEFSVDVPWDASPLAEGLLQDAPFTLVRKGNIPSRRLFCCPSKPIKIGGNEGAKENHGNLQGRIVYLKGKLAYFNPFKKLRARRLPSPAHPAPAALILDTPEQDK
ncbi:hypothetical protein N8T08_004633 [Aspergillus melleus]|uniref:Uncharacterized protein n=1 Tax=Aspergillus melleus TaxID=138277 RepID=A0ACC3B3Y3_9EURO|nr:hypothetical protein N8T08_004633 [Aspergillus melleus]